MTSLAQAWNTRFGLYKGSYSITTSSPDYTGESYTPTSWPSKSNAYAGTYAGAGTAIPNFLTARTQHLAYQANDGLNLNMGGVYHNLLCGPPELRRRPSPGDSAGCRLRRLEGQ